MQVTNDNDIDPTNDISGLKGGLHSPDCIRVDDSIKSGNYDNKKQFKLVKKSAGKVQERACVGAFEVAGKLITVFKHRLAELSDDDSENDKNRVTVDSHISQLNQTATPKQTATLEVTIDGGTTQERGGSLVFAVDDAGKLRADTVDGKFRLGALLSVSTRAAGTETAGALPFQATIATSPEDRFTRSSLVNPKDIQTGPDAEYLCLASDVITAVDTSPADSLGWLQTPTAKSLLKHESAVEDFVYDMGQMATVDLPDAC